MSSRLDPVRVLTRRKALGLNQAQLAEALGVRQETVSKIERGENKGEKAETQRQLAKILQCTVAYLIGESNDPASDSIHGDLYPPQIERPKVRPEILAPFDEALFTAMNPKQFSSEDFDAVRNAFHRTYFHIDPNADLVAIARNWLVAAKQLRIEGHTPTPEAIATRASVGKGLVAQKAAEKRDGEFHEQLKDEAKKAGFNSTEAERAERAKHLR